MHPRIHNFCCDHMGWSMAGMHTVWYPSKPSIASQQSTHILTFSFCMTVLSVYEKTLLISFMMNFTFSARTFLICHTWMCSTSVHILYGMRLCALRHQRKTGSSELVYAPLDLSRFSSPLSFKCLLEIPLDKNQLLSSLTGKQLQQTVHYSHRAPASPLPSPHFLHLHAYT